MLFRLIRLPLLLGLAFLAGMVYQGQREKQECLDKAGLLADMLCE